MITSVRFLEDWDRPRLAGTSRGLFRILPGENECPRTPVSSNDSRRTDFALLHVPFASHSTGSFSCGRHPEWIQDEKPEVAAQRCTSGTRFSITLYATIVARMTSLPPRFRVDVASQSRQPNVGDLGS